MISNNDSIELVIRLLSCQDSIKYKSLNRGFYPSISIAGLHFVAMACKILLCLMSIAVLGIVVVQGNEWKDQVHLVTEKRSYKGSFTYTIQDILKLRYIRKGPYKTRTVRSAIFSTERETDVKWYFEVHTESTVEGKTNDVQIRLYVSSLPPNIKHITGKYECGLIDVDGIKVYRQNETTTTRAERTAMLFYIKESHLTSQAKALQPSEKTTLYCKVNGALVHDLVASHDRLPTEVIENDSTPMECRRILVADTFNRLHISVDDTDTEDVPDPKGVVVLKSGDYKIRCHKKILSARSRRFQAMLNETKVATNVTTPEISFDLSQDMNPEQLKDMVSFIYWGKANHLDKTCVRLAGVADKYRIDCLKKTCLEILATFINSSNARKKLKVVDDIGESVLIKKAGHCIAYPEDTTCRSQ